jgi:hypothetical protein
VNRTEIDLVIPAVPCACLYFIKNSPPLIQCIEKHQRRLGIFLLDLPGLIFNEALKKDIERKERNERNQHE